VLLACGLAGTAAVGAYLVSGGLVGHAEPGNALVGGVVLVASALACTVVAAGFARALDAASR